MAAIVNVIARSGAHTKAIRNFAWLMVDKGLALVLGLFVFGQIARHFGPEGSGHYGYALALVQTTLALSMVCSAVALLPRLYRMHMGVPALLANVFVVRLAGSLAAAAAAAVFALLTIGDSQRLVITLIVLVTVPLIEPFYTASVYWQSRNDNRPPTLSRATGLIVRTAVVLIAIAYGAPIEVLALAWVLEAIAAAWTQAASLRKLAPLKQMARGITRRRSAALLRFGVRYLPGLALGGLYLRIDRLVLAGLLPHGDFGLYAAAMQLVEVWLQIAQLISFAAGPAFLYDALSKRRALHAYWRVAAMLTFAGLAGLGVAWLAGGPVLRLVFGADFVGAQPFLVAGTAFGVLFFIDQLVQMAIMTSNQPLVLVVKWATACVVAFIAIRAGEPSLGALAGPAGLSMGMVGGWLAAWASVTVLPRLRLSTGVRP